MKTEILTLCEYASENDGRITIVDAFETITATKFPWRAYFYIAARLDLEGRYPDGKSIAMKILSKSDPSAVIFEAESPFEHPEEFGKLNLVAGFKGLIFPEEGAYVFKIELDNATIAELVFKVSVRK